MLDNLTGKESRQLLTMATHVTAEPFPISNEELKDEAQIFAKIEATKILPESMVFSSATPVTPIPASLEGTTSVPEDSQFLLIDRLICSNRMFHSWV